MSHLYRVPPCSSRTPENTTIIVVDMIHHNYSKRILIPVPTGGWTVVLSWVQLTFQDSWSFWVLSTLQISLSDSILEPSWPNLNFIVTHNKSLFPLLSHCCLFHYIHSNIFTFCVKPLHTESCTSLCVYCSTGTWEMYSSAGESLSPPDTIRCCILLLYPRQWKFDLYSNKHGALI